MIVDLEPRSGKQKFITEQVASISLNQKGYWEVMFVPKPNDTFRKLYPYNKARLLYLTHPENIDIEGKGLYVKNRHISDVAELLRFSDGCHTFYRVTHANGYYEYLEGGDVYITRTPIDKTGESIWDYLCKLAAETGLLIQNNIDDEEGVAEIDVETDAAPSLTKNILTIQYDMVDKGRDTVPLAQYLGSKKNLIY